ncbi:hypothetical protein HGRIS_010951 [Hohenbuehelia grisea]|uniref:Fe2OG dioxygenase domain-containing protein n=1 Tax=Hohenbuehelia grisea TaxID=104357 RepID=A0ABR3IYM4_9AGAR
MALLTATSIQLDADCGLGAGDSYLVRDVLPPDLTASAFECIAEEVGWGKMFHRGGEVPRLVAVQGDIDRDGSYPIYRHPSDTSPPVLPFSPTVAAIRAHIEPIVGKLNHVLIQRYRDGADYISEHSDKTVDVVRGSNIVNVSLGAERVMVLRAKRDSVHKDAEGPHNPPRPAQRVPLPHNSMFVMGLETNQRQLHGIPHDRRPLAQKSTAEQFMGGERVSLTFRNIGTFVSHDGTKIWGTGAKSKTRDNAGDVIVGKDGESEAEKLLEAFGRENRESAFVWEDWYGQGFDVVNFGL